MLKRKIVESNFANPIQAIKLFIATLLRRPGAIEIEEAFAKSGSRYSVRVWWLLLRETIFQAMNHDLNTKSGSLTYSCILAIGPLLATAFFFFQQFGGLEKLIDETLVPLISAYFSSDVGEQLQGYLKTFVANFKPAVLGSVAIATFLVTVIGLLAGIEKCFNSIFAVSIKRPLWRQVLNYWTLITITPFVVTLSASRLSSSFSNAVWVKTAVENFYWVGSFVSFSVQAFLFSLLFYFLPNRTLPFRALLWGGIFTASLFRILQYINVMLTQNVLANTTTTALYGTAPIIAVALFFWLRLVWMVVLFGACLVVSVANFEEHFRCDDSHLAPAEGLLQCASVYAAVCDDYLRSGEGAEVSRISDTAGVSIETAQHWLNWLRKRRVLFVSNSSAEEAYLPTHYGLSLQNNPRTFVEKILFFNFKNDGSNSESGASFIEQVERILLAKASDV